MKTILLFIALTIIIHSILLYPSSDLTNQINQLIQSRNLKGIQLQITKNGQTIYQYYKGYKNQLNQSIDQNTLFRIASCSKSFSAVAIMQLVQQGKLKLNDTLTKILGFQVKNPHYPNVPITVQMILSHQSSIAQPGTQYDNFLTDTYNAANASNIPALKQILLAGGKYYNAQIFPQNRRPGQYFHYSNLGFVIAGTIIEIVSQQRFDIYMQQNVLGFISTGLVQKATFNIGTIGNYKNLGTIYIGNQGKWVPHMDNYTSTIPVRNMTGYKIGTNGAVFGPQGGLRASVRHLNNYMFIHANKGVNKNGQRLLSEQSINQIHKPRYQYHGSSGGAKIDFHLYGLGMFQTSYWKGDVVIEHEVVVGHTGVAYGLISGYNYWKDYTYSYIINGALNGYGDGGESIFYKQQNSLHQSVDSFIKQLYQNK